MGGGDREPPKTYSPQEQAQAQILIDNAESKRTSEAAAREAQKKAAEEAALRQQTQGKVAQSYAQGRSYGTNRASSLGFNDDYGIMKSYMNALNSAKAKVPTATNDVGSYFDYEDLWNDALTGAEKAQQTKLNNEFVGYNKPGWENEYFADTADDGILDAILGEQYGAAFDTVDAARARGQLSQGAFDNTLRGLDQKKLAARSTLEDMGLGVLGGYRKELGGIKDKWGDAITGYKIGQNLDLGDYRSALDTRKADLSGRMRGDIYRAVGDTNLFNTDSLMAKGSSAAGVSNNPLRNAFLNTTDPNRTTGTTGVF